MIKRKHGEDVDVEIVYDKNGRRETVLPPKRRKFSDPENARPTQFHGVPEAERAVDSEGRMLPFSLEWPE